MMEEFDFDYHFPTTEYPDSGDRLQLGNSYVYIAAPTAPDQRVLRLSFPGMRNYWDSVLAAPDITTDPKNNFYRLEKFFQRHRLWKKFTYTHPQYGVLTVTFNKPLKTPKAKAGLPGYLEGFEIELLEHV